MYAMPRLHTRCTVLIPSWFNLQQSPVARAGSGARRRGGRVQVCVCACATCAARARAAGVPHLEMSPTEFEKHAGAHRRPSACTRAQRSAAGARTPRAVCPAAPPPRPAAARPPRAGQAAAGPCPCAALPRGARGTDPNPTPTHAGMGASKKWKYTLRVENNNLQFLGLWMMQHGYHFTTAPRCGGPCRAWPPRGPHARQF